MIFEPSSTLAFEERWSPRLGKTRDELVEALCDVPPKPAAQILRIHQGREEVRS